MLCSTGLLRTISWYYQGFEIQNVVGMLWYKYIVTNRGYYKGCNCQSKSLAFVNV